MNQQLTFGETIRRLRRLKKWSLGQLSDETGLSYTYLSRVENDSASPQADVVARLAEALNGELRELLALANCLPEVILDRISRTQEEAGALNRAAHRRDQTPLEAVGALVADLAVNHGIDVSDANDFADAIERLVGMPAEQRASIVSMILTLDSNRADR